MLMVGRYRPSRFDPPTGQGSSGAIRSAQVAPPPPDAEGAPPELKSSMGERSNKPLTPGNVVREALNSL